mmetsp:Transcript_40830/g.66201  ORF Transcript_40830/g.66201 Transcript_40830/m.66201 type:complete len:499 (+) Transcript_40830:82-1578(+)|eukprot:CAMPEP_0184643692 /NCGR_PEP_ID=MMETSP0308-20130426/519_1 /TAXON_ID=38269 /ORGANISM="Gloeochaete witrockiana, Strain SAG 46.84" /LENGTH=498 /DNA_ID=CAMNT_0027071789 /DNA_START=80 /DNA_END=1576 /DNA_ORIENTATION=-
MSDDERSVNRDTPPDEDGEVPSPVPSPAVRPSSDGSEDSDGEQRSEDDNKSGRTPDLTRDEDEEEEEADNENNDKDQEKGEDGEQETSSPLPSESRANASPKSSPQQKKPPRPPRPMGPFAACRSVDCFERLNRIDEGTYGVVYRARDKETGEIVALKKVKMEKEKEGFPVTSLREINILLSIQHPNVVRVNEIVVGHNLDSIYMVMEFMEHDLKALMEYMRQPFSQSEVKCLLKQLLEGTACLHDNWVLHRDLKSSNLLMNNKGVLKICDFGLARQYGSPIRPYTHMVVTLWYRAPELLLGAKTYSTAIDIWSVGCIFAEMLTKEPLLPGKSELEQLDKIFKLLGTPNEKIWPSFKDLPGAQKAKFANIPYSTLRGKFPSASFSANKPYLTEAGFDLLNRMLTYDPKKRITASEALNHAYFTESPRPQDPAFMPTFPSTHEDPSKRRRVEDADAANERELRKALLKETSQEDNEARYSYRDRSYVTRPPPFKLKGIG